MDLREFDHSNIAGANVERLRADEAQDVSVSLTFSVRDSSALWDAAALKALSTPGMRLCDVIDVIGPRDDPSIADCIAMIVQPAPIPGCELDGFDVEASALPLAKAA